MLIWPKKQYNKLVEITNAEMKIKLGRASGPFEVNTEMIVARGKIWMEVMVKLC